ncbi:hypothetical protein PSTT_15922 [Puccinia striiformis]|uniref:Uncharacterized protein n=1 Tax=Puccinia striiformis TaxID=27350 RepID=A0A2S4UFA0_9BASI|nr:hypothetical protein PSTT_15922 [Puccinia striiformis]
MVLIAISLSTKDETTQNQANREQSETLQPNSPANKQMTQLENPQQTKEPEVNHGQLGQDVDDLEEVVEEEGSGLGPSTIDEDDDDLIICATTTTASVFHLSRIHRLIRPLKSSISSLEQQLHQSNQKLTATLSNNSKTTTYYSESKSSKRALEEDSEYISSTSKHHHHHQQKKKYRRSNLHQQRTKKTKNHHQKIINPISSPIFNNNSHTTFSLPRNNRYQSSSFNNDHHHQLIELETQIKIDKLILAYKNILDAVYPSTTTTTKSSNQISKLSTICARVIGQYIERSIELETHLNNLSGNLDDDDEDHTSISLFTEADWKTSVMDEWYDAIPLLYRRYALAQHALTMILRAFPSLINNNNHSKRNSISVNHTYQPKLIHALHHLHLNYYQTPLIQSQAILLLDHLLHSLNTKTWFEIYDDYHHKFNLNLNFIELFTNQIFQDLRFLEIFTDIELVGFLDQTIEVLGIWAIEKWINQRDSLIHSRSSWRKESKRSHDEETEEEEEEEEQVIIEYDRQSSPIILRWINSLVTACLPNSIHCLNARRQLNGISRLLFDSFMAHTYSTTTEEEEEECSAQDNYFLGLLTIIIESHRLTILGLPMFNTGSVSIRRSIYPPQNTPEEDQEEEWCSGHTPMRLQSIIGKLELPKFKKLIEMKIYNKSAKLFFRSHRTTQLLAILPGLLSSTTRDSDDEYRNRSIIPGLDQLLNSVIDGDYPLERVAKSWVQSLLQSDPTTWWSSNSSPPSTPSIDGLNDPSPSHDSNKAAHNVRIWLENWLEVLDDTEQFRIKHYLNGSSSSIEGEEDEEEEDDHHGSGLNSRLEEEEEEHVIDQSDDNKPDPLQLICTCPHLLEVQTHDSSLEEPDDLADFDLTYECEKKRNQNTSEEPKIESSKEIKKSRKEDQNEEDGNMVRNKGKKKIEVVSTSDEDQDENSSLQSSHQSQVLLDLSPPPEETFLTLEDAIKSVKKFALDHGYVIVIKSGDAKLKHLKCSKSKKCPFRGSIKYDNNQKLFKFHCSDPAHDHPATNRNTPAKGMKELDPSIVEEITKLLHEGMKAEKILPSLKSSHPDQKVTKEQIYAVTRRNKNKNHGQLSTILQLKSELSQSEFVVKSNLTKDNELPQTILPSITNALNKEKQELCDEFQKTEIKTLRNVNKIFHNCLGKISEAALRKSQRIYNKQQKPSKCTKSHHKQTGLPCYHHLHEPRQKINPNDFDSQWHYKKIDAGSTNMKDIVELDDETGQRMRAMEDQLKSMDPTERKKKLDEMSGVVEGTQTVVTC